MNKPEGCEVGLFLVVGRWLDARYPRRMVNVEAQNKIIQLLSEVSLAYSDQAVEPKRASQRKEDHDSTGDASDAADESASEG